jgi:hypothetical protein
VVAVLLVPTDITAAQVVDQTVKMVTEGVM